MVVDYIETHRDSFGVETPDLHHAVRHDCRPVAYDPPRGVQQPPSRRQVRDEQTEAELLQVHTAHYGA